MTVFCSMYCVVKSHFGMPQPLFQALFHKLEQCKADVSKEIAQKDNRLTILQESGRENLRRQYAQNIISQYKESEHYVQPEQQLCPRDAVFTESCQYLAKELARRQRAQDLASEALISV